MSTPEEIHAQMAEGYAKQRIPQAVHDERRRANHLQVRLDSELAAKFKHFRDSRGYNTNQALQFILQKFFN